MEQKKKRAENWSREEKELLCNLISDSRHIIEDKSTNSSANMQKAKEWRNIANKYNVLMDKNRTDSEIKLAWKRMKLAAKANLSLHSKKQLQTGGGDKPQSPSHLDQVIMSITPYDLLTEFNNYDSDATVTATPTMVELEIPGPSREIPKEDVVNDQERLSTSPKPMNIQRKKGQQKQHSIKETMQQTIIESNTQFKKRHLEMLEVEHSYTVKISQLKIKKLELEIDLLENKKN